MNHIFYTLMKPFFEVLEKKIGFSRIGRMNYSQSTKKYIRTPAIIIPISKFLSNDINFDMEFEHNEIFKINEEELLRSDFLHLKFKNKQFLYVHSGLLDAFKEILEKNWNYFTQENLIPIIPFNIPTTSINKEFTREEIESWMLKTSKLLEEYEDLSFGISIRLFDHHEYIFSYLTLIQEYENVKIVNFLDLFDNLRNYRRIINIVLECKKSLDRNLIFMVSGRILPKYYPIIVYLGFDLIDCSFSVYLSSENFYDSLEQLLPIYKVKYLPCSCVACRNELRVHLNEKYSSKKVQLLSLHNLCMARNQMNKIKQYIQFEDFRAYVEKSSLNELNFLSLLKILDKNYFQTTRWDTPLYQKGIKINSLGPISYFRPDFQEFRERVIERFTPEPQTSLIILLPCSSKKPYSSSKSHKKFHEALRKFPDFPNFQEIILTSPLGAIPRQLEESYPVNSYDISVTGDWDAEEIRISSEMLIELLKKYDEKIPIICHLSRDYAKIIEATRAGIHQKIHSTQIHEHVTNKHSIQSLYDKIMEHHDDFKVSNEKKGSIARSKSITRKIIKMVDYQFGKGVGDKLMNHPFRLKYNKKRNVIEVLTKINGNKLLDFKREDGIINLTLKGAEIIFQEMNNRNVIVFNGDSVQGNTLFRAGIVDFDPYLKPNEQVLILNRNKDEVIAVGKAIVGGLFIKNSKTGRIVKIHEKK
ncbi:MAG: DUF5591 domain-containing protein [Promethearchaeota archaeon]